MQMSKELLKDVEMPENREQMKYRRRGFGEGEMAKRMGNKETNELRKSRKERRNR